MNMFSSVIGASFHRKINMVNVVFDHASKEGLLFEFDDERNAEEFYNSIKLSKSKFPIRLLKTKICKHNNEYNLDVGSTVHHYRRCPDCFRSIYIDDETEEEYELRMKLTQIRFIKHSIDEKESEIEINEKKLDKLKSELMLIEKELKKIDDSNTKIKNSHSH